MTNVGIDTEIVNSLSLACNVCGWVYNGNDEDFDNLPTEYNCLECGATKVNFKPLQKNSNR